MNTMIVDGFSLSTFWSAWVIVLIVLNLGLSLFLFVWGTRVKIPTLPDGTSGHVWAHGTLREGIRKLPIWWILLSAAMFVAGIVYFVLYPGFGSYAGTLGWTAHIELAEDTKTNDAKLNEQMRRFATSSVEQLAGEDAATRIGRRLFVDNCAACHGIEGLGNFKLGAPNLVDEHWTYGGTGTDILASIVEGRHGVMPAFGGSFDAAGISNLANYVASLSGGEHSAMQAARGKTSFALCAACHGPDGKGNPALGAPNLTSGAWSFGGDIESIEHTIRHGRGGIMPSWRSRIDEPQARLIAAWIYAKSQAPEKPAP